MIVFFRKGTHTHVSRFKKSHWSSKRVLYDIFSDATQVPNFYIRPAFVQMLIRKPIFILRKEKCGLDASKIRFAKGGVFFLLESCAKIGNR